MINSMCGSMAPVASDSSSRQPASPTASVSESNVTGDLDLQLAALQSNSYNIIPGVVHSEPEEAHSFDSSIWDTIFSEVIMESPADMMISSPARVSPVNPISCCYTPNFSDNLHVVENQGVLDTPVMPFLSPSSYQDSFSFNHKANGRLHQDQQIAEQLIAGPPISGANSRHYSGLGVPIKPADVSSSIMFGHEQSMSNENTSLPKVLSAPQLMGQNDLSSLRSRRGASNVPQPVNVNVGHERRSSIDQSNDRFGYNFSASPSPCASPNPFPHTPASLLDYHQISSPNYNISRSNGALGHNSGFPTHFQQNTYQKSGITTVAAPQGQEVNAQDSGLQLVHLLLACAEAVARADYVVAHRTLVQLKQVVSPLGDSMQRVASCFTDALHARQMGTGRDSYSALRAVDVASSEEVMNAYQILYQACPYIKFAHFTANQAIFEAFDGEERVHIIDLDINQGYQWPAFVQALAARPGGAPHLRITGVGMPLEAVQETGKRLAELAESLHVPFEFHPVGERLENLQAHMFQRRIGEALAVNSVTRLHRLLSDSTNSLGALLSMIRDQAPNIVTLVEQEASHNGPFFLGRFLEALHYYSAIFDSLDATLPQNNPERTKVEKLIFSWEICNIVACEGPERVERHEKLEKWRKLMENKGFQNVPLSANAVNQSRLLLGLYPCDGYRLTEEKGCLLLGWQDRSIIAASAWRC